MGPKGWEVKKKYRKGVKLSLSGTNRATLFIALFSILWYCQLCNAMRSTFTLNEIQSKMRHRGGKTMLADNYRSILTDF